MKLIVAFDGFLNCTLTVADWLGASVETAGTVRYGVVPKRLLVAFATVTPAGRPMKRICSGPLIALPLIFVRVTVPLKVWLTRL